MKRLTGTVAELTALNTKIRQGITGQFGTECSEYFEIQNDSSGSFVIIPTDSRNPMKYLTAAQKARLTDYTPIATPIP